jgi:tetraacyldisaccharide 4'-kinase
LINALSSAYGAAALWRRRWYANPDRQHRLSRPVVSVGNLRVGGTGKTPVVEHLARLLIARGERPAVLTRGYARACPLPGATVVADGSAVLTGADVAGDEPLMLARAVPGLIVVVSANRYLAGCVAERRLRATVHILDDGFQHFELARDVDVLLVSDADVHDRPLPAGRLREPLAAAARADAALVPIADDEAAVRVAAALGIGRAFRLTHSLGGARLLNGARDGKAPMHEARAFAAAGIERPDRFYSDLQVQGWTVVGTMSWRDHHRFDADDLARVVTAARAAGADVILVTEKDAARLSAGLLPAFPFASVPLHVAIEPADTFERWLFEHLP